tara:strand:+ start:238 stop:447 length:210 start_codon:yes stop_codon:yes gene_type:complete
MKFLILFSLFSSFFIPVFSEGHKKYKKEEFEKIKQMKIEYLNKKTACIKSANNFKGLKKCWKKKKKNLN